MGSGRLDEVSGHHKRVHQLRLDDVLRGESDVHHIVTITSGGKFKTGQACLLVGTDEAHGVHDVLHVAHCLVSACWAVS